MMPSFNRLRVTPVQPQSMQLNAGALPMQSFSHLQGSLDNPGFIPLQHGGSYTQRVQPQQSFDQQQLQVGPHYRSLQYLASQQSANRPPARTYPVPPGYVNVAWSATPVPYSQSLTPPKGWVNPAINPALPKVGLNQAPISKPVPKPNLLHKLLGLL